MLCKLYMNEMGVHVVGEIVNWNWLFLSGVVIIKSKVLLPRPYLILAILFRFSSFDHIWF